MVADGSIRVPTKIDLSGLKKGIKEMERELKQAEQEYADHANYASKRLHELREEAAKGGPGGEQAQKRLLKFLKDEKAIRGELNEKINTYQKKLADAVAYHERMSKATDASDQLDRAMADDKFVSGIKTQEQYNSLLSQTRSQMAAMEAKAARISAETGVPAKNILQQNDAYQKAANTAKLLETRSEDINKNIKKSKKDLKDVNKETRKIGDSTKRGIAGFGKMQLAMMGIMMATRAISAATSEYMAVNSQLEGQMNTLKALWGQVLGPVIEWFINLIIRAVSAVNALVHALTGINFVARANAAALQKQAKATGGAAKAAQLAGFDEQTKLNDTSGGGGGDPVSLLDASMDNLPSFVEAMKEKLLAGDWYGAGKELAEAINTGIAEFDWMSAGEKLGEVLGGVLSFALGLALNLDPLTVLEGLISFITGLLNGLSEAIAGMDWFSIGGDIVEFLINSLLFALLTSDPLAMILYLIFTPKGQELTTSISKFVGSLLGGLVRAYFGAQAKLREIGEGIWEAIKGYLDEYVDWEGTPGEIIAGLLAGIVAALRDIKKWIKENIWEPLVDGFCESAGIDGETCKETKDWGNTLIESLCTGILENISKVKLACAEIWSAIKDKFSNVGTWFKEKFSDAWQKVKDVFSTGGKIFDGIKEGIADTFKTIVNGLISGINKVIQKPFNTINWLLNTIRSISVLGIQPFAGMWSYNPLSIPQIPKLALGGIVNRPGRGVPAIIGEAGAEAVLPLENNTEWMDILADKIGGGTITIPITLDGKKIATYVVDIQKKRAFAMNGA